MELTYQCSRCQAVNHRPEVQSADHAVCRLCGEVKRLHPEATEHGELRSCPCCATDDLYVQKDFPQGLGLFIVVVGFAISTVFWYLEKPVYTYLILLASALLDLVLYHRVPDVTICYRCLCQVRGEGANPTGRFHPFDLAIGERYRQERMRVEELRQRGDAIDHAVSPLSSPPVGHA